MRGGVGGWRVLRLAAAVGAVVALTACGRPNPPTPVPTFTAPSGVAGATEAATDGPIDECARLLTVDDLGALLGLPLDSVAVRTTIGVPELSVGRTERIACRYTGAPGGSTRDDALLDLSAAGYVGASAAQKQWRVNADVEDGDRRELQIGAATAILVERPGEALLTVVYGARTLTVLLPDRPLPGVRPRAGVLVDLALRVLPAISPPGTMPPLVAEPPLVADLSR